MKLILCLLVLNLCVHASESYTEWFPHTGIKHVGQTLVIHGLNTKPEKMKDIINLVNKNGSDVLLLKLLGHNNDLKEYQAVSVEKWQAQVHGAFDEIQKKNKLAGGKITFVGYSLGGLMGTLFLAKNNDYHVQQMILFAPAIEVNFKSKLIKLLFPLGNSFLVPSLTPKNFRAQNGTTIAAYKALFEGQEQFSHSSLENLNVPTTVFMDEDDELVSFEKTKKVASKFSKWEFLEVKKEKSNLVEPYSHLIIGPDTLGLREWETKIIPKFTQIFSG